MSTCRPSIKDCLVLIKVCQTLLFTACMQCNPLEELVCPEPPTLVVSGDLAKRILFIILKSLGAHGVALILGGMLLILGCIKLSFGKLIFCRKTKAEAMAEELKKRGLVNQQGEPCIVKLATVMSYIAQV